MLWSIKTDWNLNVYLTKDISFTASNSFIESHRFFDETRWHSESLNYLKNDTEITQSDRWFPVCSSPKWIRNVRSTADSPCLSSANRQYFQLMSVVVFNCKLSELSFLNIPRSISKHFFSLKHPWFKETILNKQRALGRKPIVHKPPASFPCILDICKII